MAIDIIHSGSQKVLAQKIFSDIGELLSSGKSRNAVLLVPETSKIDIEKAYMEYAGAPGIMDLEILSFSRFCLRVLDEAGKGGEGYLDDTGRAMLAYRALRSVEKKLTIFRNLCSDPRFVSGLISVMGEMKRSLVSAELLEEKASDIVDPVSAAKIRELAMIMSAYSSLLSETGMKDQQERYTDAASILEAAGEMKRKGEDNWPVNRLFGILDTPVFVLGFGELRDFTPQEYRILHTLASYTDIEFAAVCGPLEKDPAEENFGQDFFKAGRRSIEGFKTIDPGAGISYIHQEQHSDRKTIIINARDPDEEITLIAGEIKELVLKQNIRYRDIVIMSADPLRHGNLVRNIFREAGIPFYMDEKKVMKDTALGRAISSLLKIFRSGWRNTHVISYLRSGFANAGWEETDRFENFMLAAGIRFKGQLYDSDKYIDPAGDPKEDLIIFRDNVFASLLRFDSERKKCKTTEDFCDAFSTFLHTEGYEKKTNDISAALSSKGYTDEAVAAVKAWNILIDMLAQIRLLGGSEVISFEGFSGLLKSGMDQAVSGTIPHHIDCVQFSPIRVMPAGNPKVLFVAGLTSDNYPGRITEEGFLNDRDRSLLSGSLGIHIPSLVEDKSDEDMYTQYSFMNLPSELLVLSAAAQNGSAADILRSVSASNDAEDRIIRVTAKEDPLPDSVIYSSTDSLIRAVAERKENLNKEWEAAAEILSEEPSTAKKLLAVKDIKNRAGDGIKINTDLLGEIYGALPEMSISQLERYSSCPFSHFSAYLLRLKPREVRRIESSGFGSIMHGILELAAREFADKISGCTTDDERQEVLKSYEAADYMKLAAELMDKTVRRDSLHIFMEKGFRAAEGRTSLRIAEAMLRKIFGNISCEELLPAIAEWEFSPQNGNALEICTDDGKSLCFRGKVDRIDLGGGKFRIIDYKSGFSKIDKSKWYHGLSIQLPAYVAAFMNCNPGLEPQEVSYLQFGRNIVEIEGKNVCRAAERAEEKLAGRSTGNKKSKNALTSGDLKDASEHALNKASEFSGRIMRGEYPVAPRRMEKEEAACRYCDFKAVCGFDRYCRTIVLRRIKEENKDD